MKTSNPECVHTEAHNERTSHAKKQKVRPQCRNLSPLQDIGQMVDINFQMFPGVYNKYVRYKGGQNILYVQMLKALCKILVYSILYNKNYRKYIEVIGFEVNLYRIFVTN